MTTKWKKGQASPNPRGRPKNTGRPISRLRSTLNKLKRIEPEAIEIIEKVISGESEDLNKDQIDMSKWTITMINTLTRGAIAEESFKEDSNNKKKEETEEKANGTTGVPVKRFSLNMVDDD